MTLCLQAVLNSTIRPVQQVEFVNMLNATQLTRFGENLNNITPNRLALGEKWEGMTLAPVLEEGAPQDYFLFVGNDNERARSDAPDTHRYMAVMPSCSKRRGRAVFIEAMSHNITLQCGCIVRVACDPKTRLAHTRVIERCGGLCASRTHEVGVHLQVWQLLPDSSLARAHGPAPFQWGTGGDRR